MRIAELAGRAATPELLACLEALDPDAPEDYRQLAALLASEWKSSRPRWVGLGGGQGAGKSTLGRLIEAACPVVGLRACVLGIDDFYWPLSTRRQLARTIHPLLETRGPPGTHDVARCREVMERLSRDEEVEVPVFDKGIDDRSGTRRLSGPFDVVVLEGWCVGAQASPAAALLSPINELEREDDPDGVWRRFANDCLARDYAPLWSIFEALVYLQVPGLDAVRRWRLQQEEARPEDRRLDATAVDRFVQHYERITLAMLEDLAGRADLTVELLPDHSIGALRFRVP